MILRWLAPLTLVFLLWVLVVGLWLHDWRVIAGSLVAFAGVVLVEEAES